MLKSDGCSWHTYRRADFGAGAKRLRQNQLFIKLLTILQFFKKCQKQWKPVKSSSCKVTEECKNSDKLWNHHCDMKVRFFRRDFSIIMSAEAVKNILSFSRKRVIYITMVHKSGIDTGLEFRNLLQFVIWRFLERTVAFLVTRPFSWPHFHRWAASGIMTRVFFFPSLIWRSWRPSWGFCMGLAIGRVHLLVLVLLD